MSLSLKQYGHVRQLKVQGFTLIELMVVIAIIGVLATLALPIYTSYTGKAQASEGIKVTSGLRDDIAAWAADRNAFPDAAAVAATGSIGIVAASIRGKYIQDNTITVAANTGVITVNYDAGAVAGRNLQMTPTLNSNNQTQLIEWRCGGTLGSQFLPTSCQ